MKFTVTNPDGSQPDWEKIRYEEDWAWWSPKATLRFAVVANGGLIILSSIRLCNCIISIPPPGRFTVHFEEEK